MKTHIKILVIALVMAFISLRMYGNTDLGWEVSVYLKSIFLGLGLLYTYIISEKILLKLGGKTNIRLRLICYLIANVIFIAMYSMLLVNLRLMRWVIFEDFPLHSYMGNLYHNFFIAYCEQLIASILGTTVYLAYTKFICHLRLRRKQDRMNGQI